MGYVVAALLAACTVGCGFAGDLPADAVVLCRADEDCGREQRCELLTHLCVAPNTAPILTEVLFEPPVTNGDVVRLVVRADRPLDPAFTPVVELVQGTPPLGVVLESTEGDEQRLLVASDEAEEGLYTLARISLKSAAGSLSRVDVVGASLVVDRTPPVIRNARVTNTPEPGTFADVAPLDVIEARFLPSEPIASAALTVGGSRSEDCASDEGGAGEVTCRLGGAGRVADGRHLATIEVSDEAGNQTTAELAPVLFDAAPPEVVADSAVVSIIDAGRSATVASPSSDLRLDLLVSEDLGTEPSVAFDVDGVRVPLDLVDRSGRRCTFRLAPGSAIPIGTWKLVATLVDRFAHAADVVVELAAPYADGVPFTTAGGLCAPPPGTSCVDFDGDGRSSVFSCADGDDPRDDDASVFPGAPELPGDGLDNNGIAGDLAIDESSGIFVDSTAGDDGNAGTRTSPVRTLGAAKALLGSGGFLFLAASATPYSFAVANDARGTSILGGLDPSSWTRSEARSVLLGDVQSASLLDSVETEGTFVGNGPLLFVIRTHAGRLNVFDTSNTDQVHPSAFVIDSAFGSIDTHSGRVDLIDVTTNVISIANDLFGQRVVVNGPVSTIDSSVTLINSVVTGGVVTNRTVFNAIHSTLLGTEGPAFYGADTAGTLAGSAFVRTGATVAVDGNNLGLSLFGSNFTNDGGSLIRVRFDNVTDIDAINACAFTGCNIASGNISVPPGFTSAFHIGEASAMKDAAVVAGFQMPPSAASDIDRDCRYADGTPDVGADESL